MMNKILVLLAAAALSAPAFADTLRKSDVKIFDLWTKAVREDYTLYRSLEDEALLSPRKVEPAQEKGMLTHNLHQDLEPDPAVTTRLVAAGKPFSDVDNCRIAVRRFRVIMTTAQRVNSINDKTYRYDAQEYLRAADRCEKGMKFPPFSNRFREVVRTVFQTEVP